MSINSFKKTNFRVFSVYSSKKGFVAVCKQHDRSKDVKFMCCFLRYCQWLEASEDSFETPGNADWKYH